MSKVFDYIHNKGYKIAERRALAADPELAAREALRRTKPGVIIGSDDELGLTLDDFFGDMTTKQNYRTWWHKASLRIHWFLQKRGPRALRGQIETFVERGKQGWSHRDVWSFDSYLADVIIGGVTQLRQNSHGHPGDLPDMAAWHAILDEIIDGMEAAKQLIEMDYDIKDKQAETDLHNRHEKAMDLLKEWFFGLWD